MSSKNILWSSLFLVSTTLLGGCASSKRECDYVFFAPMHCVDPVVAKPVARGRALPARTAIAARPVKPVESLQPVSPAPLAAAAPVVAVKPAAPSPVEPPPVPDVNAVYFTPGQSFLSPGAKLTVDKIATFLGQLKDEKISIASYTDPSGSQAKNKVIASQRSQSIVDYLAAKGIDPSRVTVLPHALPKNDLDKSEYWRLRKAVILYSAEVLVQIEKQERLEEQEADRAAKPEPSTKPVVAVRKPTPGESPAKEGLEKIDVIYWKSVTHGLFIIAKKAGFFEQEGFDVRLHESKLEANELSIQLADQVGRIKGSIPRSANDLKNKKYFLGAVCPYGLHEALGKKLPFVEIGAMLSVPSTMIATRTFVEAARKNLRNFRGTIGRVKDSPTEVENIYLLVDRLTQVGLKEGADYKFVFYDTQTAMFEGLFKGEITTAMSAPPYDEMLLAGHPEFGFFPISALNLNLPCCRQIVTRDNLKKNRPKYVRFERAVIRAQRFLVEHPAEASEMLSNFLGYPLDKVKGILQRQGFGLSSNPNVRGAAQFAASMEKRLGKAKVGDIREATDTSIYEEALAGLVKEDPNKVYTSILETYNKTR